MSNPIERVAANWRAVQAEVAEAAQQCGRDPAAVRIIGVTKYVDAETARALVEAGCRDLGESRPQSLWDKYETMADLEVNWHFIGHLQRNKARRTVPVLDWMHSIDSERIAAAVSQAALAENETVSPANAPGVPPAPSPLPVLLEVNISGDEAKHGFAPEQMLEAIERLAQLPGLKIGGLMGMASYDRRGSEARQDFASLRQLRDALVNQGLPSNVQLNELSMGMSGDFREAIAEGATMVRIGSRLFE